jgi:hypothetical protein
VTSIERTAYPQFKKLTSARVLHVFFTPTAEEIAWSRERTKTPEACFAQVLDLKCFQKMARFCSLEEIPEAVVDHVRRCLGLEADVEPDHGASRTAKLHRKQVRARQGAKYDMVRARAIAAAAIRKTAEKKNHPPDLINIALEKLVEASLELPGFSTLDEMATRIRAEVNAEIFAQVVARMAPEGRQQMQALLATAELDGRSMFNRLKKPAQRASWSRFKAQADYLEQVDELGDTAAWMEGISPSKVADFAGEAAAQDAAAMGDYEPTKRLALVACLVHTARMQARDDLAEMFCKRVAGNLKKAKTELEEIQKRQRATSERLIGTYRNVLEHLDPDGPADQDDDVTCEEAGGPEPTPKLRDGASRAVEVVRQAGGFAAQLADIEEVSAFHGDNYEVLVHRFFRKDRAVMFDLVDKLELVATSTDDSVLAALENARAHWALRRDFIPVPPPVDSAVEVDRFVDVNDAGDVDAAGWDMSGIAFASGNWQRAVTDRRPHRSGPGQHRQAEDPTAARRPGPDLPEGVRGEDQRQARRRGPAGAAGGAVAHPRRGHADRPGGRPPRPQPAGGVDRSQRPVPARCRRQGAGGHRGRRAHRALLILDLALALSEDRRRDIVRKTKDGLEAARRRSRVGGRRPVVDDDKRAAILARRQRGEIHPHHRRRSQGLRRRRPQNPDRRPTETGTVTPAAPLTPLNHPALLWGLGQLRE